MERLPVYNFSLGKFDHPLLCGLEIQEKSKPAGSFRIGKRALLIRRPTRR